MHIFQAIQNLGLGVVTLVAGDIVDRHGYLWLELFFMAWLVVGMICIVAIYALDMKVKFEYSLHWVLRPAPVTGVKVAKPKSGR